jgi:hypothetical protein
MGAAPILRRAATRGIRLAMPRPMRILQLNIWGRNEPYTEEEECLALDESRPMRFLTTSSWSRPTFAAAC